MAHSKEKTKNYLSEGLLSSDHSNDNANEFSEDQPRLQKKNLSKNKSMTMDHKKSCLKQ